MRAMGTPNPSPQMPARDQTCAQAFRRLVLRVAMITLPPAVAHILASLTRSSLPYVSGCLASRRVIGKAVELVLQEKTWGNLSRHVSQERRAWL